MDPEFARDCARRYIENEIYAVGHDAPRHLWDLCPDAYALIEDDVEARDELWAAVCDELAEAEVTYRLRGESAADAQRRRLAVEVEEARIAALNANTRYDEALGRLRDAAAPGPPG